MFATPLRSFIIWIILSLNLVASGLAQPSGTGRDNIALNPTSLNLHWKLQNASLVTATPDQISGAGFNDSKWLPAVVPGTVLGSYRAAGAIPDPWFGDQMNQLSDTFFSHNDFWYRNTFTISPDNKGHRLWLAFDGINWKADIYMNGSYLGHIDGAFLRHRFDITAIARYGAGNDLAVLIRQVAHPDHGTRPPGVEKVTHKKLGSPTTNGDLLGFDSPTFLSSAGWNWLPIIRGRNIGIWNDVRLEMTDDVTLDDPWVTSTLPDIPGTDRPDTSSADLTVKTSITNHSTLPVTGTLNGSIGNINFSLPVSLDPAETRQLTLDNKDFARLRIHNPRLWWPNDYGNQPLYTLRLQFVSNDHISDQKTIHFGIRKIEYKVIDNILTLYVNGQRILVRGGNWGDEEGMLNCDSAGYDLRVRLHHDAHFQMIRNWIGMVGRDAFYDACDRYGILIWDDFWLANPVDGPNPQDSIMFMTNARDKIRRVRSHPSLALYCGRNEGDPPPFLDSAMRSEVRLLDGTRHYIPHSAAYTVTGLGPYDVRPPEWYFLNRGKTFHSELGIIAIPTVESMREMMPAKDLWPINDMWAIHDYQSPRSDLYTRRINDRYGVATGIEDYCRKAQLLNWESAKAMFECLQDRQGSGILLWMSQSAWPSLICQLYDYYFEMTAAYFGVKKGCEPVHILWNAATDSIKVANNTAARLDHATAEAIVYDIRGREKWRSSTPVDCPPEASTAVFALQRPAGLSSVFFIRLRLTKAGKLLSDNFYWTAAGNCQALNYLPQVNILATATGSRKGKDVSLTVHLRNPSSTVALMIRLKIQRGNTGRRVLPVFFEDNYVSLLPGESTTVHLSFDANLLGGTSPKLLQEGFNIRPKEIPVTPELSSAHSKSLTHPLSPHHPISSP